MCQQTTLRFSETELIYLTNQNRKLCKLQNGLHRKISFEDGFFLNILKRL